MDPRAFPQQHEVPISMRTDPLQQQALTRTRELLEEAAHWLGVTIPPVEIRFDQRGRAAGQARFGLRTPWVIRYNPILLAENPREFIAETVPHEVAHVAAFARYSDHIRPHGREWQAIMRHLGAEPRRCHDYDVTATSHRKVRRFDYHCDCRDHQLTSIRHNRVLAGQTYICRSCAQPLRPGRRLAVQEQGSGSGGKD
jgi:SprT protein